MGGPGSGRWVHSCTKPTVEGSYALDSRKWAKDGTIKPRGLWIGSTTWRNSGTQEVLSSIGVEVSCQEDFGVARLHYTRTQYDGEKEDLDYQVRLVTTRPHLGGLRWWFICPLVRGGIPCARRVAKLYRRTKYFGCRNCVGLAYRSSQEAHKDDRSERNLRKMVLRYGSLRRVLDNPDMLRSSELITIIRTLD
jgi:hypothetical protein